MNPSTENSRTECNGGRSSSSQQSADSPRLCSGGCGFYGTAENRGMCSKCFKDSNKDKIPKSESAMIAGEKGVSDESKSDEPRLCSGGCCFYGAAENRGMCSKCFKDFHRDKMPKSESAVIATEQGVSAESKIKIPTELEAPRIGVSSKNASSSTDQSVLETSRIDVSNSNNGSSSRNQAVPVVRNRCGSCKKKVGMLGFGCRCGGTFCGKHRYPEEHSCDFDFKKAGKIMIEKENPLGRPDKIKYRI